MHYLSNNQGSEFILQIIIAFVASMAKISQSSEPLTGCAFSGKHRPLVYNAKPIVRDLAVSWELSHCGVRLLLLYDPNQSINQSISLVCGSSMGFGH